MKCFSTSILLLVSSTILLLGCNGGESMRDRNERVLTETAVTTCKSYGFKVGTANYNQCVGNETRNKQNDDAMWELKQQAQRDKISKLFGT